MNNETFDPNKFLVEKREELKKDPNNVKKIEGFRAELNEILKTSKLPVKIPHEDTLYDIVFFHGEEAMKKMKETFTVMASAVNFTDFQEKMKNV